MSFITTCPKYSASPVFQAVYFTAFFPYIVLSILLVRSLTLEGSVNGIIYYFKPQWEKLGEAKVCLYYSLQTIYGWLVDLSVPINWKNPFPILGVSGVQFCSVLSISHRNSYKQTVQTLIRCHILRDLIWVYTVRLDPIYRMRSVYGLRNSNIPLKNKVPVSRKQFHYIKPCIVSLCQKSQTELKDQHLSQVSEKSNELKRNVLT